MEYEELQTGYRALGSHVTNLDLVLGTPCGPLNHARSDT